jgi:hypothetical protein
MKYLVLATSLVLATTLLPGSRRHKPPPERRKASQTRPRASVTTQPVRQTRVGRCNHPIGSKVQPSSKKNAPRTAGRVCLLMPEQVRKSRIGYLATRDRSN